MADSQLFEKYGHLIPAGQVIFRENEDGEEMFIIQDGKVRISRTINGKEHILAILGKGDFFGETAIVTRVKRTASAIAVTDTHLLSFNRQGFHGMIEKNSKIAMNVIDKLCRRLQNANTQIQHLKRKNEKSLVALALIYAFEETSGEEASIPLDSTAEEIALSLDAPAGDVKNMIACLANSGILASEKGRLKLLDKEGLREASETSGSV